MLWTVMLPCKAVLTRKIAETRRERSVLSCTCLLSCLSSTSEDENSGLLVYLSYLYIYIYISAWKKMKIQHLKMEHRSSSSWEKSACDSLLSATLRTQEETPSSFSAHVTGVLIDCSKRFSGSIWIFDKVQPAVVFFFYQGEDETASLFSLELQSCSNSRL